MNAQGNHGALLHEEFDWKCWGDGCKVHVKSSDYMLIYQTMERHHNRTGHHQGRLKITKVVETWK